jgi:arylsulfatase A-like enzyme
MVPAGALFDLEKDVAETMDVSKKNVKIAERMKSLAAELARELGDGVRNGTGVRKAGFVENAVPMNLKNRPNILFIAIDDMNDWTTLFDPGNPIETPNLLRLASRGCFFTKAYCTTAACNPSRTAIMTGLHATTTGIYSNEKGWAETLPDVVTLPQHFMKHGYASRGGGKIFHHGRTGNDRPDNPSFQEFFKMRQHANAPEINYNGYIKDTPGIKFLARHSFDWGVHDVEKHTDEYTVEYIEGVMEREWNSGMKHPMFLAAGIFRPHLPFWAPPRSFDHYPLNELVMPPMPGNDLDDVGEIARRMAHTEYFIYSNVTKKPAGHPGSLQRMVQSYQASATFSDEMVGRLLDKLDETGMRDNTIIVLWSDHGYHLGDKEACVKFTLWEKANHVPFIIVAPGVTTPGSRCDVPVSLLDIYPTLAELAGLPPKAGIDGQSLVPLLENPDAKWDRPALMTMGRGNHAVRSRNWRYIRYSDGTEELYDQLQDPWNHNNLAGNQEYAPVIAEHKKWLPEREAPE